MHRMKAMQLVVALAAALMLGLAACSGSSNAGSSSASTSSSASASSAEAGTNQVVVAMSAGSEPEMGFNPIMNWGCGEHAHEPLIQSTLITTDENLEFVNDLATDYSVSDDGLTWTFGVRDDVTFSDGEPLTASDVAFTINTILETSASEADLSMVESAEAPDPTTAVIHLNKPYNALLYTLAVLGIVPEHAYGADYGISPEATIGSGRYLLEQWDQGQQAILTANPGYYGDAPQMDRVVVLFMEEDAALAAVQSGQADVAYTSAVLADTQVDGYSLLNCKSVDSRGISMPCVASGAPEKEDAGEKYAVGNDVTCNRAFRQAVNYGVDRTTMVNDILNGYGTEAYSVGDGLPWANPAMKCDTDQDLAMKTLEDDGWALGSDGVYEKDGLRASVGLYYPASDSVRQAFANEFANQMAAIGVEINLHGSSWDEIYPHQYTDMVLWGWGSNGPTEIYSLNYSTSSGNFSNYQNEAVDAYIDAALAAPTIEESYELWQKSEWDGETGPAPQGDATWVWFANIDHLYFARDGLNIADQKPHPHGHGWSLLNNVDQWTW